MRHETLSLANPVPTTAERGNDQEGTIGGARRAQVAEAGKSLNGLTQPHVVREDTASTVVQRVDTPVHPLRLVRLQECALCEDLSMRVFEKIRHVKP